MAYIDSEMAKRHDRSPLPESGEVRQQTEVYEGGEPSIPGAQREPASLGKLHEIDLGQETKMQNIARTQAATRRLAGDEDTPIFGESEAQPDRSGPDKPWRNRARRTSAAIERDRLVEEVLRESKRKPICPLFVPFPPGSISVLWRPLSFSPSLCASRCIQTHADLFSSGCL